MPFTYEPPKGLPPEGTNCQSIDGKIDGRGSTYQEEPQQTLLSKSFTMHTCGKEVRLQFAGDPAEHGMVAYNYPNARERPMTGSGVAIETMSCRTDDFTGTDFPYSQSELADALDGLPRSALRCHESMYEGFEPPFQPTPGPWPEAGGDHEAKVMAFPIGGSSVAILVHLTSASCGGSEPPTRFEFTPLELSRIFGGDAQRWNDEELVSNNPGLSPCTAWIQRVVDEDDSGTTSILKSMFVNEEERPFGNSSEPAVSENGIILNTRGPSREGPPHDFGCARGHWWSEYAAPPNTNWPHGGEGGSCSPEPVYRPFRPGDLAEIQQLSEEPNGIGYADLPQAIGVGVEIFHMAIATVRNATGNRYEPANSGRAANCHFAATASLPGTNAEEAVGLNTADDWAYDNKAANGKPNHGDATLKGERYPICGLTWDMVYTHMASSSDPEVAIKRLSADQRMTEFSYFSWLLNQGAQQQLGKDYYAPLPESWLELLRPGFEANF
jgi:ABC-type phosphate transport system substrate-binding protein